MSQPKKTASKSKKRSGRKTIKSPPAGPMLLEHVCKLTGLHTEKLRSDLQQILDDRNIEIQNLTLDELRQTAAHYLRQIMSSLLEKQNERKH